ncbi:MAG: hypothetical protein ACKV19_19410 [Verrucomicrobiales bacterium]
MGDDAAETPTPPQHEPPVHAGSAPASRPKLSRQPRAKPSWEERVTGPPRPTPSPAPPSGQPRPTAASWEPPQREPRRPDFVDRLTKTTDLPTEIAKERQKSKLGEHRLAALRWEEESEEHDDEAADQAQEGGDAPAAAGLGRGRVATLAGLGVVVAVLGVMSFAKSLLIGGGSPTVPPAVRPAEPSRPVSAVPLLTDPDYAEAEDVMRRFLEALTPDDLKPVIREPERVWPLVEAHTKRVPWKPFVVRRLPAKHEIQMNRGLMAGAVEVDDYQRFVVAMERTLDGIKVDWETFTGQGEMSWEDFVTQRPTTPVLMRVSMRADDYFNVDFPDSSTHACYRLSAHRDTHRLYGYVERGSAVHAQLATRMRVNPGIMPTLRLKFPDSSTSADQVEIAEIVADGWLVTENTRVKPDKEPKPPDQEAAPKPPPASGP